VHSGYAGFRLGALGRFGRWPARWRSALAVVAASAGRALRIATRTAETAEATAVVTQSTRVVHQHGRGGPVSLSQPAPAKALLLLRAAAPAPELPAS
jgi:hypothetical protein